MNKINGAGFQPFKPDEFSNIVRPVEPKAETPKSPAFNPEAEQKLPPPPLPSQLMSTHDIVRIAELMQNIRTQSEDTE